jgi:hypothetical protein
MKTIETDALYILAKSYAARAMHEYASKIDDRNAYAAARDIATFAVELALTELADPAKIGGNHD